MMDQITNATVRLLNKGCHGVLVPGNFIVTAAHCVTWDIEGRMVLGEYYVEAITTASGDRLKVAPWVIEPCSDIAVLGSLDEQECEQEAEGFARFCEHTPPVEICTDEFELFAPIRVRVLSRRGTWIDAEVRQYRPGAQSLPITTTKKIEGGMSGGPVVNDKGLLIGIVSSAWATPDSDCLNGQVPRPHLAVPVWCSKLICARVSQT